MSRSTISWSGVRTLVRSTATSTSVAPPTIASAIAVVPVDDLVAVGPADTPDPHRIPDRRASRPRSRSCAGDRRDESPRDLEHLRIGARSEVVARERDARACVRDVCTVHQVVVAERWGFDGAAQQVDMRSVEHSRRGPQQVAGAIRVLVRAQAVHPAQEEPLDGHPGASSVELLATKQEVRVPRADERAARPRARRTGARNASTVRRAVPPARRRSPCVRRTIRPTWWRMRRRRVGAGCDDATVVIMRARS